MRKGRCFFLFFFLFFFFVNFFPALYYTKMGEVYRLPFYQTKKAQKPSPLGRHIPMSYVRSTPSPCGLFP